MTELSRAPPSTSVGSCNCHLCSWVLHASLDYRAKCIHQPNRSLHLPRDFIVAHQAKNYSASGRDSF
jgi:hypothetical protein